MDITLNNKRILLVDDEPENLKTIKSLLEKEGYEIVAVKDGEEGYKIAKSFRPSLIISDLIMPVVDGIQFLNKIRSDVNLKDTGFVILTGKDSRESRITGLSKGADDYLTRPFDSEEFLARIKNNIRVCNYQNEIKLKNSKLEEAYSRLKSIQSQILQQEKMASIGQLAAGVAHEINNPIGFIMSNLNTLGKYANKILEFLNAQSEVIDKLSTPSNKDIDIILNGIKEKKESLKIDYILNDIESLIKESTDGTSRVKDIVLNLKSFAHLDEAELKQADINAGLKSTLNIVWNELKYKITLEKEYGNIPLTKCNLGELNQVFMNVLVNAGQAIKERGLIMIKTWSDSNDIYISISDTGNGIPKEFQKKLFEPFFTTKKVGEGTGLGLSIAFDVVKKHKGTIEVKSEEGKGTTFLIKIPVVH